MLATGPYRVLSNSLICSGPVLQTGPKTVCGKSIVTNFSLLYFKMKASIFYPFFRSLFSIPDSRLVILQKLNPISLDGDIIITINILINLSVLEKWSAQKRSIKKLPTCGHHCDQLLVSQADEPFFALVTPPTSIQRSHFGQTAVDCLENAEVHTEMRLARHV